MLALQKEVATALKPAPLYQVVAWDIGDIQPKVIKHGVYNEHQAHKLAKDNLLYGTAEYTGVKNLGMEAPYWDAVYTIKQGVVVDDSVE